QQVARTPNTDVKGWRSWPRAQGNAPLTPEGMRVTVPAGLLKALPDNGDVEVKCDAKGNRVEQTTPPLATAGASAFDQRVRYVEFRGLTFEGTDRLPEDQWPKDWLKRNAENPDGALCLQGVEACTITDCTFRNCGAYGVVLDHYAQRVSVLGNEMTRLGSGGVQATGYGPGTLDVNGHHVIRPENARAAGREGRPNDRDVRVPEHWRIRDFQSASHPSEGSGRRALALLRFRGRRRHLQLQTVPVHRGRDRQRSIVPLMRGCAMVRLRK
ncbi:MAG: right-handed parallel beta-helix repeat-containing protein, partial [Verrucomicrobiota bacterium]